jgi:micrococcal nuclease
VRWLFPLLAGVALLVPLAVSAETAGPLLRVLDGDTYEMMLEGFPTRVRLANADTPETGSRAKCAQELDWGNRATDFVRDQVSRGAVAVFPTAKLDKYRRVLATVTIDGEDLGGLLVKNGLARWYGGERRLGWCGER